jgi:hypothetical protein
LGERTVLRGCLLDSRADTTTADSKGVIYILDVSQDVAQKPGTPARPKGNDTSAAALAKTRYALSKERADVPVDFARHVGHRVALTGRVFERLQTGKANSGKPTASNTGIKPLPGAPLRMFQVSALKMIAAKCP